MNITLAKLLIVPLVAATGVLLTPASSQAQRGRGRGADGLPPGQERKAEPVSVPEPGTMTLLTLGIGGGLIARALRRR